MKAGFDFLSTENGFSEFTHPDDSKQFFRIISKKKNYCINYL